MSKAIVVNVGERETRIAVTEDGKLVELHIEREERVVGSLYKAKVANVLPGMDAAFVDVGLDRNAFLYVGDVIPTSEEGAEVVRERPSAKIAVEDVDDEDDEDDDIEEHAAADPSAQVGEPSAAGRRPVRRFS